MCTLCSVRSSGIRARKGLGGLLCAGAYANAYAYAGHFRERVAAFVPDDWTNAMELLQDYLDATSYASLLFRGAIPSVPKVP